MLSHTPPGFPVKELNRRVVPQGYQMGLCARIESVRLVALRFHLAAQGRLARRGSFNGLERLDIFRHV